MMRRLVLLLGALATAASFAPVGAQVYPPAPTGADCSVTGISVRVRRGRLRVKITIDNHGAVRARCRTTLAASTNPPLPVRGSPKDKRVRPRRTKRISMKVDGAPPPTIHLTACSTAIDPAESHTADDCKTADVT